MKALYLVLSLCFFSTASFADDCQDAIFKLHDTLSSKSTNQVNAAFSGVLLAGQLGLTDLTKGLLTAYSSSAEVKASTNDFFESVKAVSGACRAKSKECRIAATTWINQLNEPKNRYARMLAISELVKMGTDGKLFEAVQASLAEESDRYVKADSSALDSAVDACK